MISGLVRGSTENILLNRFSVDKKKMGHFAIEIEFRSSVISTVGTANLLLMR